MSVIDSPGAGPRRAAGRDAPQSPGRLSPLRTGLATVCISGTLEDKLSAASSAGFDGVEIFEPDFVASSWSATQVRQRCADLDLSIDLYQPFRDFDSVDADQFSRNLRRAELKFDVMAELGTDLILVCSAASPSAVRDDSRLVDQFGRLADIAGARGMRVAYEALAWASYVNTYEHSWRIVRDVDHPALGLCVDSFHILSRGSDPAGIENIPAEKLLFLQLADAPHLAMDVLQWSRHYRLFPGQGQFDLSAFLGHVLAAGYTGPLSLEVFNDVFRQADPERAAVDALRSLLILQERAFGSSRAGVDIPSNARASDQIPAVTDLSGFAFVELAVDAPQIEPVAQTLAALRFQRVGHHRTKPVDLWRSGDACVLLNSAAGVATQATAVAAIGVESSDPARAAARAGALLAPVLPRRRGPAEAELAAVLAPDATEVFFCRSAPREGSWLDDFLPVDPAPVGGAQVSARTGASAAAVITGVDHVALTQPFDRFDEATLFYRALLGLQPHQSSEIAAPFGLVRNRALSDRTGTVRICLSVSVLRRGTDWRPGATDPQHVAFTTDDAIGTAQLAAAAGARIVPVPANYYDDLDARLALPSALISELRAANVLFDRVPAGDFLHFYTEVFGGRLFLEVVQRVDDYQGYGETNAPIRMAAHRRQRSESGAMQQVK